MKHLKSFLTILMVSMPFFTSATQSSDSNPKPRPPITLEKGKGQHPIKCPKSPDRQVITCTYDGEDIYLSFTISEGTAALTIIDASLQISSYHIDTSSLEVKIDIGKHPGSISIILDTEMGNQYNGIIEEIF